MSSSSSNAVTVLWDFQYSWIPQGYDLRTLKTNIETALKKCNPEFFIQGKMIAAGHATGDKHQAITMLPDDIEFSPVPPGNLRTPDPEDQTALHLAMKIFGTVFDRRPNILIISSNHDVMSAIKKWKSSGVFMMLALLENSTPSFNPFADVAWLWTSEDPERAAATMVNGGGPIPPVPRVRG